MFIVFTGTTLEVDLDLNETSGLVQAMSEQAPAHNIVEASGKRHVVNMRQVLCLQIEPGQPDSGAPEETGEAATPSADNLLPPVHRVLQGRPQELVGLDLPPVAELPAGQPPLNL